MNYRALKNMTSVVIYYINTDPQRIGASMQAKSNTCLFKRAGFIYDINQTNTENCCDSHVLELHY